MTDVDDVTAWERKTAQSWERTKSRHRSSKVRSDTARTAPSDIMADAMELVAKGENLLRATKVFESEHPGVLDLARERLHYLRNRRVK